jgi:hypothetical protein
LSGGLVVLFRFRFGKPEKVRYIIERKELQPIEGAGIAKLYLHLKNYGT